MSKPIFRTFADEIHPTIVEVAPPPFRVEIRI